MKSKTLTIVLLVLITLAVLWTKGKIQPALDAVLK